jgi:hypothetical protein
VGRHLALVAVVAALACSCARDECPGCPRFADGDGRHACACKEGSVLLAGGCVSRATADDFCGLGAHFDTGSCRLVDCPPGQAIDLSTGACLPMRAVREVAHAEHVSLAKQETIGCKGDRPALLEGGHAACVPDDVLCPRGARWVDAHAAVPGDAGASRAGSCVLPPRCDPGEVADAESGMCLRVVTPGGHLGPKVDVGRWVRAVLGADGGMGSPSFCAPFALRPSLFALTAGGTARLRATLEIFFPDADVTQLYARVASFDDATGQPLPAEVARFVEARAAPLLEALRAIGGESSAGAVKTTVRCAVRTVDHPIAVPRPEGAPRPPSADAGDDDDDG